MRQSTCGFCGELFPFRQRKQFCSQRCRLAAWREQPVPAANPCTYCGLPADSIDHVPPQSVRPILTGLQVTRFAFVEVAACRQCNSYLSDRQPWTVAGRKQRIKEWLKRRYGAYLRMPDWSDTELCELGRTMQEFVVEGQIMKRLIQQRLRW
jgi:hypothetical protein